MKAALAQLAMFTWIACGLSLPAHAQNEGFPRPEYYISFVPFYEGEFRDAAQAFRSSARSGLRSIEGRWIDSICYHAMLGESFYHAGEPVAAMEEYTAALKLFLAHRNWLLAIQFPPNLTAQVSAPAVPWGAKTRRSAYGKFPQRMMSASGQLDLTQTLQQGGVARPAQYLSVDATEVARCIGVALRRRAELLGPNAPHDPLTGQLITTLTARPAPPNHWSQAWVECWLGLAYLAADRPAEAATSLQASLVMSGDFDHPLTPLALMELGKLALRQGRFDEGQLLLLEATYPAVVYEQFDIIEEALRWGALAHIVSGSQGAYAPVAAAIGWPRKSTAHLATSLLLEQTEQLLRTQPNAAPAMLEQARRALGRRQMAAGLIGSRYQWLSAVINLHAGKIEAGNAALAQALKAQQRTSLWLFQLAMADRLAVSGAVTERVADELYGILLREPTRADWLAAPQETLAVWMTAQDAALEHWFELALQRNEPAKALEIADQLRRRQFLISLPLGGRMQALRWVLEAPDELLSDEAQLQRRDLLGRHPDYDQAARRVAELRRELDTISVATEDAEAAERQLELAVELKKLSDLQELILWRMAVGREVVEFAFPPRLDAKQFSERLPPGQVVLAFHATRGSLHVFQIDHEGQQAWRVPGASKLRGVVANLLRQMGHLDGNLALGRKELEDTAWKSTAQQLFRTLLNQKSDGEIKLPGKDCQELVIVPQGPLWYVPFEAIPLNEDGTDPLITKVRLRYAPLVSLAAADPRRTGPTAETLVVSGKLHPKDADDRTSTCVTEWLASLPELRRFRGSQIPTALLAPFCERLVVLAQVDEQLRRGPLGFAPWPGDAAHHDGTLAAWLQLPWGAPQVIVLPAFVTPAENALKKGGSGDEIFLTACGLMAAGSRSVLLSRWRVAGDSTCRLMREYLQELPHLSSANAWQRAVQLVRPQELDLTQEPRVDRGDFSEPITAEHPFFWAGYMVIGSGE